MDKESKANTSSAEDRVMGVHYLDSSPSLFISKQASRVRMPERESHIFILCVPRPNLPPPPPPSSLAFVPAPSNSEILRITAGQKQLCLKGMPILHAGTLWTQMTEAVGMMSMSSFAGAVTVAIWAFAKIHEKPRGTTTLIHNPSM